MSPQQFLEPEPGHSLALARNARYYLQGFQAAYQALPDTHPAKLHYAAVAAVANVTPQPDDRDWEDPPKT